MWLMHRPGEPEQEDKWDQFSEFYKDLRFNFTVSEFDCEKKVQVFCKEQDLTNKVHGSEFNATNFLSQYQIQTHQGTNTQNFQKQTKKIKLKISNFFLYFFFLFVEFLN